MKKLYSIAFILSMFLLNAQAYNRTNFGFGENSGVTDSSKKAVKTSSKITDTRKEKPAYLQSEVNLNITPFKPAAAKISAVTPGTASAPAKAPQPDLKVVSNVKVYPNPVAEQLHLSYVVNKDSNVTIKIMDVLGNEIATLLSQRMPAGEQTNSFAIASKLNSGYYFIRLIVGSETIVKRISIL